MWRKFALVCSNYCLQRIAVPPEKRGGREKETKKKRLHSENNYFVPNCHSAPANKNFPSQRKMLGKVSAKRCIWDLAFKQVSWNLNIYKVGWIPPLVTKSVCNEKWSLSQAVSWRSVGYPRKWRKVYVRKEKWSLSQAMSWRSVGGLLVTKRVLSLT